jgi:hypothetical protein
LCVNGFGLDAYRSVQLNCDRRPKRVRWRHLAAGTGTAQCLPGAPVSKFQLLVHEQRRNRLTLQKPVTNFSTWISATDPVRCPDTGTIPGAEACSEEPKPFPKVKRLHPWPAGCGFFLRLLGRHFQRRNCRRKWKNVNEYRNKVHRSYDI